MGFVTIKLTTIFGRIFLFVTFSKAPNSRKSKLLFWMSTGMGGSSPTWMSQEVCKRLISRLQPQYTPFISRWNNPLILTIDPNFLSGTSVCTVGSPAIFAIGPCVVAGCMATAKVDAPSRLGRWWKCRKVGDLVGLLLVVLVYGLVGGVVDLGGDGGFKYFFMFTPNLGEMIQFDVHIFSNGLVQPPTSCWCVWIRAKSLEGHN